MRYRDLGRTGIRVSAIGFGGWGIGGWGPRDDGAARLAIGRALDLGVTLFDTARGYGDGHSERLLGAALGPHRQRVVLATKVPPRTGRWPVLPGDPLEETFPAGWIVEQTEASLRALGTDYLDLQQLHAWTDAYTRRDEWHDALARLREQGKIRAFGVSTNDWDADGAVGLVEAGRTGSVQAVYNVFEQRPDERLFPAARAQGVGVLVRVPLEEGLLTGAIRPGHAFPAGDWRAEWLTPERIAAAQPRLERLRQRLGPQHPTPAALALRFCLRPEAVSAVLVGMRRPEHVAPNCAVADLPPLPDDDVRALRELAWPHGWAYPWSQAPARPPAGQGPDGASGGG